MQIKQFSILILAFSILLLLFVMISNFLFQNFSVSIEIKEKKRGNLIVNDKTDSHWNISQKAYAEPNVETLGCFDYMGDSSNELTGNSPWSTIKSPIRPYLGNNEEEFPLHTLTDLNGDGLPDLLYINHIKKNVYQKGSYSYIRDCIMLNNGNGWDIAYRCKTERDNDGSLLYYGDCAKF